MNLGEELDKSQFSQVSDLGPKYITLEQRLQNQKHNLNATKYDMTNPWPNSGAPINVPDSRNAKGFTQINTPTNPYLVEGEPIDLDRFKTTPTKFDSFVNSVPDKVETLFSKVKNTLGSLSPF